jgi:carboxymethylenebutenolidase
MRSVCLATFACLALAGTARAQSADPHAAHAAMESAPAAAAPVVARDPHLPADEAGAAHVLESSPRHGEFVDIAGPDGVKLRTWIVYPERHNRAGVVVLIHEIFGLSPWLRSTADQLAAEGFIAVAPDLVSGLGPGGGGTDSAASRDDVVKMVRSLTPEMSQARLDAVCDWAAKQPAGNGRIGTIGFCWGGGTSFAYAAHRPGLRAAVVYYGVSPDSAALQRVGAPVLGLYGGDDARVTSTIDPAKKALAARKKTYETHVFEGAGHGFLRQQADRNGANLRATQQAWPRTVAFLKKYLE